MMKIWKGKKKNLIFHEKGIKEILNSSPSKIFIINLTFLQIKETHHTHKKIIQSNKTHTMDRKVGLSFAKKAPQKCVWPTAIHIPNINMQYKRKYSLSLSKTYKYPPILVRNLSCRKVKRIPGKFLVEWTKKSTHINSIRTKSHTLIT